MRTAALLLPSLLFSFAAAAQMPSQQGPVDDPLAKAKRADFLLRYADEVRARKAFDDAHLALRTGALKDAVHEFEKGVKPPLAVTWDEFITSQGTTFIAVQLAPPAGTLDPKEKVVVFGEIVNAQGKVLYDFEEPQTVQQSKRDLFTERTLILPPGTATGTFGLAQRGTIVAMARTTIDCRELTKTTPGLSRLFVSNNVYNLPHVQGQFDPFAFGGTKVVPKPDRAFSRADELWLFAEMRNPALGKDGAPSISVNIAVERNGKKVVRMPVTVEPFALKGVDGHFGIGTTLDFSTFAPGEYKLRVTLVDALASQTYEREESIKLIE